jgi:hypothetical protein
MFKPVKETSGSALPSQLALDVRSRRHDRE